MSWQSVRRKLPNGAPAVALSVILLLAVLRATGVTSVRDHPSASRDVTVDYVLDGDTFQTTNGERIRLLGIDAPEVARHSTQGDPYSIESTEWLKKQIGGKTVRLSFDQRDKDMYDRTLAWVWQGDVLVNEQSLCTGHAKLLDKFGLPLKLEHRLRSAEADAKVQNLGLWK